MQTQFPRISLQKFWQHHQQGLTGDQAYLEIAQNIDKICQQIGFFVLDDHNIDQKLFHRVHELALKFFELPEQQKQKISMEKGGKAWRGWFPLGNELTSGQADGKQGIYFGTEDQNDDIRPLHGSNLFPDDALPEMRETILKYIEQLTKLGHILMRFFAKALRMPLTYFQQNITKDPTILFRIFQYPPNPKFQFGVGQHTDYGLLTLLCIDSSGGLQVKTTSNKWIKAPCPQPGKYLMIINIGDMLQKMSEGRYKSLPHRVRNQYTQRRISFPLFFDPSWQAEVKRLPLQKYQKSERWDGQNLGAWQGEYGTYLTNKVSKCFPELFGNTIVQQQKQQN